MEQEPNQQKRNRLKLGGLWARQLSDGRQVLSGPLSPFLELVIFENGFQRAGSNDPQYVAYVAPRNGRGEKKAADPEEKVE